MAKRTPIAVTPGKPDQADFLVSPHKLAAFARLGPTLSTDAAPACMLLLVCPQATPSRIARQIRGEPDGSATAAIKAWQKGRRDT